jgi:hypothetical protein
MEFRELILLAGGMSLGFGLGLLVYAVHRIRETRHARWFRKSDKRYADLIEKINKSETAMRSHVDELTALKEEYSNVK